MARSGLQQDVINMYRRGVRMVYTKPRDVRAQFLLHLRYSFRNPKLGPRDYSAIEHQLRRMDRTLEMFETGNVNRINLTSDMEDWWAEQIRAKSKGVEGDQGASTR